VGRRSWLKHFRKREDEAALKRAEDMQLESPDERRISEGDIDGMTADERAGEMWGETPGGATRLAERDEE
jgi:hypothetical protein